MSRFVNMFFIIFGIQLTFKFFDMPIGLSLFISAILALGIYGLRYDDREK